MLPPAAPPLVPVGTRKPPPNIERASSYSLRCFSSDRTLYASVISLKRSPASAFPLFAFASGWYLRARSRYAFLMSAVFAVLGTPSVL